MGISSYSIRLSIPTTTTTTKSLQSCLTLCNPIDSSPPGSPIPGILQARTLEWVAISFSNAWKWKVKVKSLSSVWLLATPWTAAHQVLCPWDFPGKSTGVGCHCLLRHVVSGYYTEQLYCKAVQVIFLVLQKSDPSCRGMFSWQNQDWNSDQSCFSLLFQF